MINPNSNQVEKEQPTSLINFINILFKRKKIILSFLITVVSVVTIFSFIMPPIYQANSKLLLERELDSEKSLLFRMNLPQSYGQDDWINTEIEILNSYPVAHEVVEIFGLDQTEKKETGLTKSEKKKKLQQTIKSFQKKLIVENLQKSNVLDVSYESKDPELAAKVVNKVIEVYVSHRSKISNETDTYKFFEDQIRVADEKLRELEQRQADYKEEKEVVSPEAQRNILLTRLEDYEKSLTDVQTKRIGKEAQLEVIKAQLARGETGSIPSTESSNSLSREKYIAKLRGDLLDMKIQREKLLQKFTPQYEEVQNLDRQISATKEQIEKEIREIINMEEASIKAMRAEEAAIRTSLVKVKKEIRDHAQEEYEFTQLSRGIDDNREVYSMLLKQREEARISLAKLEKGVKIKIISPAVMQTDPVKPRKALNILLAIFLGIFGGLGLAFFVEYFDHTISNPAELEKYTGMNVLGSVREIKTLVTSDQGFR